MSVLVDTSVWVEYLRGSGALEEVDFLIDESLLMTNELIQAELLPFLLARGESELVDLLRDIPICPLQVDWDDIVMLQVTCLRNGINKVGIPDLIIAQNAIRNGLRVFSVDKHFRLLHQVIPIDLYEP
ncbi:MAG: PIN domain-containing protein [Lentisphaeria bacterium]|nr:PIN domain-containing protein [Lentisphaeria bacterium]